jgi:hypothetical protein
MLMAILCLQAAVDDSLHAPAPGIAMTSRCSLVLLCALLFAATPTLADGMLLPGWEPIADQALGDIRVAVARPQPNASTGAPSEVRPGSATPVVDAFIAAQGSAAEARSPQARLDELMAQLWRGNTGQGTGETNGADRVAQAFSVGNATAQLANSIYGGPPGAAAYAAWWAYQQPGATAQQALAVGLLAGAGLWASQKDPGNPDLTPRVSQQTSLAAALGGLAVAAAGGDDQALRALFFDAGAAVLVQDGPRLYCVSGTLQCQRPPAKAAAYRDGQLKGWALDQLAPVVAVSEASPAPAEAQSIVSAQVARAAGALPLNTRWTLIWQFPETLDRGLLYPSVALVQGSVPAAPAAPAPTLAAATGTTRYLCEKGADVRTLWTIPGDPKAGYVCRTMYQIDQTQAVLWNARQNPDACESKARAQVSREQAHGYRCRLVDR